MKRMHKGSIKERMKEITEYDTNIPFMQMFEGSFIPPNKDREKHKIDKFANDTIEKILQPSKI